MKSNRHSISISQLLILLAGLGLLVLLATACAPAATPPPAAPPATAPSTNSIQDIVWQWVSLTEQPGSTTTTVPDPEKYTITFLADSTLTGNADCNAFAGTYSQENGFSITLGPSTMAFCGEASLDQQYLQLLSEVAAGGPDGAGGLALENAGGEKRMLFKNGGAAPKP